MKKSTKMFIIIGLAGGLLAGLLAYQQVQLNASTSTSVASRMLWQQLQGRLTVLTLCEFALAVALMILALHATISEAQHRSTLQEAANLLLPLANVPEGGSDMQSATSAIQTACRTIALSMAEVKRNEKLLIEQAVDVVCVIDSDEQFRWVSKACRKAWGYDPPDLQGHPVRSFLEGRDAYNIIERVLSAPKSIETVTFESQLRRKDGGLLDVIWTGHWSASEGGLFCIVTDITRQKHVEKEIRESEHRLRTALESLPVGVLAIDAAHQVEFANSAAHSIFSCAAGEIVGKTTGQFFADSLGQLQASGETSCETDAFTRSGETIPVEVWKSQIELGGQPKDLLVFMDISAKRELERVKSEFIAMVTHDLKSPLSSLQGLLVLLEHGVLGELSLEGSRIAAGVQKDCKRMMRLLGDLLDLEKIESGTFELALSATNLRDTISDAVESVRPAAGEKKLRLETSLEDVVCSVDEERVVQVLNNLFTNSIKYAPEQSTIQVSLKAENGNAMIRVSDQGRGIPAEMISRVFHKFEQVDKTDAREKSGTGLGLAICKTIIEKHGGSIGVDSIMGRGSTFWFTLPREG